MITVKNKEKKIIICKGDTKPARFWDWVVCTEKEYTEEMMKNGWVIADSTKYLSLEQLDYLNENV